MAAVHEIFASPEYNSRQGAYASPPVSDLGCTLVSQALAAAIVEETERPSGQSGYDDDPDVRRGEEPPPIDDTVFLSHDPVVSNFQSALEEYVLTRAEDRVVSELASGNDCRGGGVFDAIGAYAVKDVVPRTRAADGRRLFDQFSETDPGWIASLFAIGVQAMKKTHPFNPKPSTPLKIGDKARLVLVADWATGLPRAREVGKQMRAVIENGRAGGIEQHVIVIVHILTPKDLLTKDDTWINKEDFIREYHDIPMAIGDAQLRDRIDAYFQSVLPKRPTKKEHDQAARKAKAMVHRILAAKAPSWKYEREQRTFVDLATSRTENGNYFHRIPPDCLVKVVLGITCQVQEAEVKGALQKGGLDDVEVVRARRCLTRFKVLV
jgi:hypothetical protein